MKPSTAQITLRIPREWLAEADALAKLFSRDGAPVTQSAAFKAAIARGLKELRKDLK